MAARARRGLRRRRVAASRPCGGQRAPGGHAGPETPSRLWRDRREAGTRCPRKRGCGRPSATFTVDAHVTLASACCAGYAPSPLRLVTLVNPLFSCPKRGLQRGGMRRWKRPSNCEQRVGGSGPGLGRRRGALGLTDAKAGGPSAPRSPHTAGRRPGPSARLHTRENHSRIPDLGTPHAHPSLAPWRPP